MSAPLITDDDVSVLNHARTILTKVGQAANRRDSHLRVDKEEYDEYGAASWDLGIAFERTVAAEGAIFQTLNVLKNYCGVELTYEQLHNREAPESEEDVARDEAFVAAHEETEAWDPNA